MNYYDHVCRSSSSAGSTSETDSVAPPLSAYHPSDCGLLSYTVQSVCTLLDQEGHCKSVNTLREEKRSLEEQLERLKALRVEWATPEYFYDTMKFAQQAKKREEERSKALRVEMTGLREELAEAMLLPIELEGQIEALRGQLETTSKEYEMEKELHQLAVVSQNESNQKHDAAWQVLTRQQKQLQEYTLKLSDSAGLIDQLSSANGEARETIHRIEQEVKMARGATEDAEKRLMLTEANAASYQASAEREYVILQVKHEEIVASLKDAVESVNAKLSKMMVAKNAKIRKLSKTITEAKDEVSKLEAEIRRCNETASARVETVLRDLVVRDEQIRSLKLAVKSATKITSKELTETVQAKDAEIQRLSQMLTTTNQHASDMEISRKNASESQILAEARTRDLLRDVESRDNALAILKDANIGLSKDAAEASERYSRAAAIIEDMSTRAEKREEVQAELTSENLTLKASLDAKDLQVSDLTSNLKTSENKQLELEEKMIELNARNATLILEKERFQTKIKRQAALITKQGSNLRRYVRQDFKLRTKLKSVKHLKKAMISKLKIQEDSNHLLRAESRALLEQLANTQTTVVSLVESNAAKDEQNRLLRTELSAEVKKLSEAEAKAQWIRLIFDTEVYGLHTHNMTLMHQISQLEKVNETYAEVIKGLQRKTDDAGLRNIDIDRSIIAALEKTLRGFFEKDIKIPKPTDPLMGAESRSALIAEDTIMNSQKLGIQANSTSRHQEIVDSQGRPVEIAQVQFPKSDVIQIHFFLEQGPHGSCAKVAPPNATPKLVAGMGQETEARVVDLTLGRREKSRSSPATPIPLVEPSIASPPILTTNAGADDKGVDLQVDNEAVQEKEYNEKGVLGSPDWNGESAGAGPDISADIRDPESSPSHRTGRKRDYVKSLLMPKLFRGNGESVEESPAIGILRRRVVF